MFKLKKLQNTVIFSLEKETSEDRINFFLTNLDFLKQFSEIEISLFVYPLGKNLNSDSFKILPFEEYIEDVKDEKRSTYRLVSPFLDKFSGIILSVLIVLLFAIINPAEIVSIESIISILAAYAIGKEFWNDLEALLINKTQNLKISFRPREYFYELQTFGTIQRFTDYARNKRYNSKNILPPKIDFIHQSNSKMLELLLTKPFLKKINTDSVRLLVLDIEKKDFEEFTSLGFMVGFKITLVKNYFLFKLKQDLFQSIENKNIGSIDSKHKFYKDSVLLRQSLNFGRLKIYLNEKIINNLKIIFTK